MTRTFALICVIAFAALQASAVRAQPTVKNWQKVLDQNVTIVQSTAFTMSGHSASVSGTGSAMLDSGSVWVNPGAAMTVNFTNTDDAIFQQCVGALSATGHSLYISGHGYYSMSMQNGAVKSATVTLDALTTCNGGM